MSATTTDLPDAAPSGPRAPGTDAALAPQVSHRRLTWRRFTRDRFAFASLAFLMLLLAMLTVGERLLVRLLGHGPNDTFPYSVNAAFEPAGPWTHVPDAISFMERPPEETTLFVLGADGLLGRDLLLRILDGGQVTLMVAAGGTLLALAIGLAVGIAAAYFGGWTDAVLTRVIDMTMAFPVLFFVILLASTAGRELSDVTFGVLPEGVLALVLIIGAFTWFYPARIVRTEVLALRSADFVEAARMIGAGELRILRTHLLPHLVPPLIVYATVLIPVNILLEAGLSFLGFGISLPNASWGSLLTSAWGTAREPNPGSLEDAPWITLFPSLAILLTVLALNAVGDGLRAALDPRGVRR